MTREPRPPGSGFGGEGLPSESGASRGEAAPSQSRLARVCPVVLSVEFFAGGQVPPAFVCDEAFMVLIDTHAHLDDDRFADDLPAVLDRASAAGVERVLTIGIDAPASRAALALARRFPERLSAVVGIQPNHVAEIANGDWDEVVAMSRDAQVVAIGETGLDRYWDRAPFDLQEDYFVRQLDLCQEVGKPVVIHCREAEADVVRVLRTHFEKHGPVSGVMHSFTGDATTARACLDMGLHISFAGMLTYKTAEELRTVAKEIPLERLLVETDSPYLAPVPMRGKRNEPAFVAHTAACLAGLKGVTVAELAEATTRNARKLFGLAMPCS